MNNSVLIFINVWPPVKYLRYQLNPFCTSDWMGRPNSLNTKGSSPKIFNRVTWLFVGIFSVSTTLAAHGIRQLKSPSLMLQALCPLISLVKS